MLIRGARRMLDGHLRQGWSGEESSDNCERLLVDKPGMGVQGARLVGGERAAGCRTRSRPCRKIARGWTATDGETSIDAAFQFRRSSCAANALPRFKNSSGKPLCLHQMYLVPGCHTKRHSHCYTASRQQADSVVRTWQKQRPLGRLGDAYDVVVIEQIVDAEFEPRLIPAGTFSDRIVEEDVADTERLNRNHLIHGGAVYGGIIVPHIANPLVEKPYIKIFLLV